MNRALIRVRHAAADRARSEADYRAAIAAARAAGESFPAIAEAAGTTRQAVRQLLRRAAEQELRGNGG